MPLADRDKPVVLVERQPSQHDGVDDGEDGRAGADAEGEHRQGHDGEGSRTGEGAEGGLEVVAHIFFPVEYPRSRL